MPKMRILLTADTHLGFDLPFRPRVRRRRRGEDFFANYRRVLTAARNQGADAIIHGGDLFYRSRVPRQLVEMVFEPLKAVAASGIPVFIVPGNHERSRIPHSELSQHPHVHVFTRPTTFVLEKGGRTLALSGFPFVREHIRDRFGSLVEATDWRRTAADRRLLCIHQSVAGARVGPSDYVFRRGADVIRPQDIAPAFTALLAGHIHRFQVLERDLSGTPLAVPVFYPGAIERVSFAERDEIKGFLLLTLDLAASDERRGMQWEFVPLPSRPMFMLKLRPGTMDGPAFTALLHRRVSRLPADAIIHLKLIGRVMETHMAALRADTLRDLAGPGRNIRASWVDASTSSW